MKLVYIVVRPSKVEVVKSALAAINIGGPTLFDVRGLGLPEDIQVLTEVHNT